jgi:putative holliday junction resolvase
VRVLALDPGRRRIGVAVSDPSGTLASPHGVVKRGSWWAEDHRRIADLVRELDAELVVVGLPLSLDGSEGPAATRTLAEVEQLRSVLDVPVETYDERFTTVTAESALRAGGVTGQARRQVVDQAAAAVLLQAWLDRRAAAGEAREGAR